MFSSLSPLWLDKCNVKHLNNNMKNKSLKTHINPNCSYTIELFKIH